MSVRYLIIDVEELSKCLYEVHILKADRLVDPYFNIYGLDSQSGVRD